MSNFWQQRTFTPRVMPGNQFSNVAVPPKKFPWGAFSNNKVDNSYTLPWNRPNLPSWAVGRREDAGLPVGNGNGQNRPVRPLPPRGAPVDRNPNKPGLGWGGLNPKRQNPGPGGNADIITFNIKGGRRPQAVRRDLLNMLEYNPNLLGLQEMRSKSRMNMVRKVLNNNGYGLFGGLGTPVAYRKKGNKIVDRGSKFLTGSKFVGAAGAGPSTLNPKAANYLVLKNKKTGGLTSLTNLHAAPSQYLAVRNQLARTQFRKTAQLQKQLENKYGKGLAQLVVGDMNTNKMGKFKPFRSSGIRAYKSPSGTFGKRQIDWIMSDRGLGNRRVVNTGSDHKAYMGSLRPRSNANRYKRQNPNPPRRRF